MTPERLAELRLAELRLMAEHQRGMEALGEVLAAYDAIADGSAVRSARASERDALRRAGDAEERAEWLGRMLDAAAADLTEARGTIEVMRVEREASRLQTERWCREVARERDGWREKAKQKWAMRREIEEAIGVTSEDASDDSLAKGLAAIKALRVERDEARAALANLRADVDAEVCGRLALRKRYGVADHETWPEFIARLADTAASRSAKGVPALEIAANQVPSQPGVIAKLLAEHDRTSTRATSAFDAIGAGGPWRAPTDAAISDAKALGRVIGLREALAAAMEPTDAASPWKAREVVIERIRRLLVAP